MGTPLPPVEDGELCDSCWGPGKPFGDNATPNVVQMTLSLLLPGEFFGEIDPANLLTTHWLTQLAVPCVFNVEDGDVSWQLFWGPLRTTIRVFPRSTDHRIFIAVVETTCVIDTPNQLTDPEGVINYNGFVNITFI